MPEEDDDGAYINEKDGRIQDMRDYMFTALAERSSREKVSKEG